MATHLQKFAPLETKRRLSESILWTWQRGYFEREGMGAWRDGTVPHHITCSPVLADAYVEILFGFLRDSPPDPREPFYIVEIGAGSGRLGYLVLSRLLEKLKHSSLKDVRIRYVLTDFTDSSVEYWRDHGWLQTFIESGVVDVGRFDAEENGPLRLAISGETLSPGTLRNPLAVIANYVFDGFPQDAFRIREGQLYETLITVSSPRYEADPDDPDLLGRAEFQYHYEPAAGNHYEDAEWNTMLQAYCQRLPAADLLFPVAALRCIGNLDKLAGGRLALLSADRGYNCDAAILEESGTPKIYRHGSFSLPVDYQLIGEYFLRRGGRALHPDHWHASLNVSAFLLGENGGEYVETRMAYDQAIGKFGPDDFFTLKDGVERLYDSLTTDQIIAFLRLSAWDYLRFLHCLPVLFQRLEDASEVQKLQLYGAIRNVWNSYFPIGEEEDVAFQMGSLLLGMEYYAEALEFFGHSAGLYGQHYGTILNTGICYYGLQQLEPAREYIDRALEIHPESDVARAMQLELRNAAESPEA